jgi:biotin operon repressor
MAAAVRMLPVSAGLLNHRRNMGSSVWDYLWLLKHVTDVEPGENETSVGIVDHGNPVPTNRIAADLKRSREATLANLERLEAGNYINRSAAAGHAYTYRVCILPAELSE